MNMSRTSLAISSRSAAERKRASHLTIAFLLSKWAATVFGISLHPHTFACATCHFTLCSIVALAGIRFF